MNLPTFIVLMLVVALVVVCIRYLIKTAGSCAGCSSQGSCSGACVTGRNPAKDPEYRKKAALIDEIIEKHQRR